MTAKKRRKPTVKKPAPPGLRFEDAMTSLRHGKEIRRRGWAGPSRIFKLGTDVFLKLPNKIDRAPSVWHPYPEDFLATDWEVAVRTADVTTDPAKHRADIARSDRYREDDGL